MRTFSDANLTEDPYMVFTSSFSMLSKTEVDGIQYYEIDNPNVYRAQNVRFPVHKPANSVRIFCLGGSAAAGWPHPQEESYTEYLKEYLSLALPDRSVEVHNVAGHGHASYRVRMVFDQVVECDPDLLIIYSGNNEFNEDRTYGPSGARGAVLTLALRSRLIQRFRAWTLSNLLPDATLPGAHKRTGNRWIWSNAQRIAHKLHSDPQQLALVHEHYAYSMDYMWRKARDRGVAILFLTVPTNLRDWHPHVSTHGVDSESLAAWKDNYDRGRRFLAEGNPREAVPFLENAVRIDPAHADTQFYLARALEGVGRGSEALAAYRAAKDDDQNGRRALTAFNDTLRRLSKEYDPDGLIDMEGVFERSAEGAAPGFDLFLDYVHPTKQGNQLIARSILRWILEDGGGGIAPRGSEQRYSDAIDAYIDSGYRDEDDVNMLHVVLQMCGLMHQYDAYIALANVILQDPAIEEATAEQIKERRDHFTEYLASERSELVGQAFDPDYRRKHEAFYEQMVDAPPSRPGY